jgi:hypothetical protein
VISANNWQHCGFSAMPTISGGAERGATACVVFGEMYTAANSGKFQAADQARILTARAATSAIVNSEIAASAIMRSFARGDSGIVSVGEKAVAFVKDRKR